MLHTGTIRHMGTYTPAGQNPKAEWLLSTSSRLSTFIPITSLHLEINSSQLSKGSQGQEGWVLLKTLPFLALQLQQRSWSLICKLGVFGLSTEDKTKPKSKPSRSHGLTDTVFGASPEWSHLIHAISPESKAWYLFYGLSMEATWQSPVNMKPWDSNLNPGWGSTVPTYQFPMWADSKYYSISPKCSICVPRPCQHAICSIFWRSFF